MEALRSKAKRLVARGWLAARRRVDGLREEADRIQAELAVAELEWQEAVGDQGAAHPRLRGRRN
ncbi:hypothetical protein ACH4PR_51945 [Streptomyces mirabilis]|uniref:hypothetical protein n=1 Tax=Streptomyces mirabilis TaxID=68239 RepID=UPI003792F2FF